MNEKEKKEKKEAYDLLFDLVIKSFLNFSKGFGKNIDEGYKVYCGLSDMLADILTEEGKGYLKERIKKFEKEIEKGRSGSTNTVR
jgi:hypothetical protein